MTVKRWVSLGGGGVAVAVILWMLIVPSAVRQEPWLPSSFSGAVLVAKGDQVLFRGFQGLADRRLQEKLDFRSSFLIGPLTEQFTAVLTLQLVDQGLLSLEGLVSDYLPEFPSEKGEVLTVHNLLSHTSGLPGHFGFQNTGLTEAVFRTTAYTPGELAAVVGAMDLVGEPGSRYLHSSAGYLLLGALLEKVSGQPLSELLEEKIVRPLGLTATGYVSDEREIPGLAQDYLFNGVGDGELRRFLDLGLIKEAPSRDLSNAFSAEGMYSTVDDLFRWSQALHARGSHGESELLSAEMTDRLFSPNFRGYGYGIFRNAEEIFRLNPQTQLFSRGGEMEGYSAFSGHYDDGTSVILLSNILDEANQGLTRDLHLRANDLPSPSSALASPSSRSLDAFENEGGMVAFRRYYRELSERAGYEIRPSARETIRVAGMFLSNGRYDDADNFLRQSLHSHLEAEEGRFNRLGYAFLARRQTGTAIRVFEHNARANPGSANTFDSLGEALEEKRDLAAALLNYRRAVELGTESSDRRLRAFRENLERVERELLGDSQSPVEP